MRWIPAWTLLLLLTTTALAVTEANVSFEFRDPKTKKVLLTGSEQVRSVGGAVVKHTEYRDGRKLLATEDATIDPKRQVLSRYHFRDLATGEEATLALEGGKADVTYRKAAGKGVDEEVIDWGAHSIHGKLLPELLLGHWDELRRGETIEFDLYVPFRLETIRFRARKNDKPMVISRTSLVTFRIEPSNLLIRQLAPTIYFTFEDSPRRRLVHYRGPSMVDIDGEKNRKVDIFFGPSA